MKRRFAALVLCALALMAVGELAVGQTRWIVGPVRLFAVGDSVALAANNGWTVTRRQTGRIHLTYSNRPPSEMRHVYHRSFKDGVWEDPDPVSEPDTYACEGVIASQNYPWFDTVAFAYCSARDEQSTTPTMVMCRVWYVPDANGWHDPEELYPGQRGWTHELVRHPSIVLPYENEAANESHAITVWADTCVDEQGSPIPWGWYLFYGLVDVNYLGNGEPEFRGPADELEAEEDLFADYPSIAWNYCDIGNNSPDFFVAYQRKTDANQGSPTRIYALHKTASAGGTPMAQISSGSNVVDSLPSCQVVAPYYGSPDRDTFLVAFQRNANGSSVPRIWRVLGRYVPGGAERIEVLAQNEVFPSWRSSWGSMRAPNLWCSGNDLAMVFESNPLVSSSPMATYVSTSYDATRQHGSNTWITPMRLPGMDQDQASIYGDAVQLDVVCRRKSDFGSTIPRLLLTVLFANDVPVSPFAENVCRGLQQIGAQGDYMHRVFIADSFVAMDLSTDNGANWVSAGSPGFGEKPALALDSDSILCAAYVKGCTLYCNWWYPYWYDWVSQETVFAGGAGEVIGQPTVALYPGKSDGVKVAAVSAVVYDTTGNSRVMFFKVDTGHVMQDTVASASNVGDSFPCLNVAFSDSVYLTFQRGDSVVSNKLLDYGRGNWNRPPAWEGLELVTASGYHPMSQIEDGDMLHCVWTQCIPVTGTADTFNIRHATCDVSPGALYPDWTAGTNPSNSAPATAEKSSSVYAGVGVTCWLEQVSGDWVVKARVRDSIKTLASATDTNLASPHALAESSAITPSIDQVRVKLYYMKVVVDSGDTCGIPSFETDSFNVSNAGAGATKANNGTKLVRKPSGDSLFAVYADADGGVYFAKSAAGDSWKRSELCGNGEYPALGYDGAGKLWVVYHDAQETKVLARYRCSGDTWSTAKTVYTLGHDDTISGISLVGSPDGTNSCAYAAFQRNNQGSKSIIVAKFNKDSLRTTTLTQGEVDNPCIAVEASGGQGDWLHVAYEWNGNVVYTMATDDWGAENWQSFPSWEQEVILFESGQQAAHHPCLVANEDKLVVACALGTTPDIYARERLTSADYDDWDDTLNLSTSTGTSDYPVVFLGDSIAVAWEEHRNKEDYDILACINYGDTFELGGDATQTSYPHIVLQSVTSPDTTVILHLLTSEKPSTDYYEVGYAKLDLADMGGGQQSADVTPLVIQPELFPCRPNPFTGHTAISYQFGRPGNVALRVYDATGRMVKSLVEGVQKPGKYTSVWNATDQRGRTVPRGIYFYRLDAPGYRATKKAVLMQ